MPDTSTGLGPLEKIISKYTQPVDLSALPGVSGRQTNTLNGFPDTLSVRQLPSNDASPSGFGQEQAYDFGDLTPPQSLVPAFESTAKQYNVPVNILMAMAQQESSYDTNVVNGIGATGLMQYIPDTAKALGIDPTNPIQSIDAAAKQLRYRLDHGWSMVDAVRGHFAGPNRELWGDDTQAYGPEVLAKAKQIGHTLYPNYYDNGVAIGQTYRPQQSEVADIQALADQEAGRQAESAQAATQPDYDGQRARQVQSLAGDEFVERTGGYPLGDNPKQDSWGGQPWAGQTGPSNIDTGIGSQGRVAYRKPIAIKTEDGARVIPTRINGEVVTPEKAVAHYRKTGKSFGLFDSVQAAQEWRDRNVYEGPGDELTGLDTDPNAKPLGQVAVDSAVRGWYQLKNLGVGIAGLTADLAGADKTANSLLTKYVKEQARIAKQNPAEVESFTGIKSLNDMGAYAVQMISQNLPMLVPSIVTGGVGAAVARKAGEKAVARFVVAQMAKGATKAEANKMAAKLVARQVMKGSAAGALATSVPLESGSIYASIYAESGKMQPWQALAFGVPAGVLDAIEPVYALSKVAGPAVNQLSSGIIKSMGREAGTQFLIEGGTEGLQTLLEIAPVSQATGEPYWTWETYEQALNAALAGGLTGGVVGTVTGAASHGEQGNVTRGDQSEGAKATPEPPPNIPPADNGPVSRAINEGLETAAQQRVVVTTPDGAQTTGFVQDAQSTSITILDDNGQRHSFNTEDVLVEPAVSTTVDVAPELPPGAERAEPMPPQEAVTAETVEPVADNQRIKITTRDGTQIFGFLDAYQAIEGGFKARVIDDDGQVRHYTQADNVTIEPARPEDNADTEKAQSQQSDTTPNEEPPPSKEATQQDDLMGLSNDELAARLQRVREQAKRNGGWSKPLIEQRNRIQAARQPEQVQQEQTAEETPDTEPDKKAETETKTGGPAGDKPSTRGGKPLIKVTNAAGATVRVRQDQFESELKRVPTFRENGTRITGRGSTIDTSQYQPVQPGDAPKMEQVIAESIDDLRAEQNEASATQSGERVARDQALQGRVETPAQGDNGNAQASERQALDTGAQDALTERPSQHQAAGEITVPESWRSMSFNDLVKAARSYAREKFAGETVRNVHDGSDIKIPWQGIKHALSGVKSRNTAYAARDLGQIISTAEPVSTEPDHSDRPNIKAVHRYETTQNVGGEATHFAVVVREHDDGRRFYDHYEIKNPDGSSGTNTSEEALRHQPSSGRGNLSRADSVPESSGKKGANLGRDVPEPTQHQQLTQQMTNNGWQQNEANPRQFTRGNTTVDLGDDTADVRTPQMTTEVSLGDVTPETALADINATAAESTQAADEQVQEAPESKPDQVEQTPKQQQVTQPDAAESEPESNTDQVNEQFAENTIFTADKVAQARARLKKKLGTLNSGIDPEVMMDGLIISGAYIESGVRSFADYANAMVADLGDAVKPYLLSFYEGARNYPGLDTAGMTDVTEARRHYEQLLQPQDTTTQAIGEVVPKPRKRTPKKGRAADRTLTQDWGVDQVDGYGDDPSRETGSTTKDEFLKETRLYLNAIKNVLTERGYTPYTDDKGRPQKAVSVNESGIATSGDVTLSLKGPDGRGAYIHIGDTALRGAVPTTDGGIAIMYRATDNVDKFGSGTNQWAPTALSARDLADLIDAHVSQETRNAADVQDRESADRAGIPGAGERRGNDTQSPAARGHSGSLEAVPPADAGAPEAVGNGGQAGVRHAGTDVAGGRRTEGGGLAVHGRTRASGAPSPYDGGRRTGAGSRTRSRRQPDSGTPVPDSPVKNPETTSTGNPGPGDLVIENPLEVVGGGQVTRFNRNREALELRDKLLDAGRQPTREEQKTLAGYTGWGSFGQELFQGSWDNPKPKDGWEERSEWLREFLSESDWKGAQASIINAHYTDPPTVMAMWAMMQRMGFAGGRVLEPSMGIGNFFGMMPAELAGASARTGIELDPVTGSMAQLLYPESNVQIKGYETSTTPDGFYDVVIGNWPFADFSPADRRYNRIKPLLHDYFFLKALDQTRPGGLVMGVTSKGTLDKKNSRVRTELAKKGELVAAFRLPSGAFEDYAGTKVVTDIIILRKRDEPAGIVANEGWIQSQAMDTPAGEPVFVNEYYHTHPSHVLGTIDYGHGTTSFRAGMIVKRPDNLSERLHNAIAQVPEDAYRDSRAGEHIQYVTNHTDDRTNALVHTDDGFFVVRGEHLAPANDVAKYRVKSGQTTQQREAQFAALISLRKQYAQLVTAERYNDNAEAERTKLREQYDAYKAEHGQYTGSYGLKYLERIGDPFEPSLAALESASEDGTVTPARILSESTMRRSVRVANPDIVDAFVIARTQNANPTLAQIADIANKPEAEVRQALIESGAAFASPAGDVVPADIYLSGNVRRKLRDAKAALEAGDTAMQHNIDALNDVKPPDIPYYQIETQFGATWVPRQAYAEYVAHMLGLANTDDIQVTYDAGQWKIEFPSAYNNRQEAQTGFGTGAVKFKRLVNAAVGNQSITIRHTDPVTKTTYVDDEATKEVNAKIADMRMSFGDWLWSDPQRQVDLEAEYNESRNPYATPKFDGSFLPLDGMALSRGDGSFELRQHQIDAIWRGIVTRKSLMAHQVGTGKSLVIGGLAVESRRYGIAQKPLVFAHNANSKSLASEIQSMYPAAKVLYIDNLSPKTIDNKLMQIANDDWDAVVLPHSLIDRLGFKEDTLMTMAQKELDELEQAAREAADEDGANFDADMLTDEDELKKLRSPTAKQLVKQRFKILQTIQKLAQRGSRENAVSFEDLGVDMVLVDEAHSFRKATLSTQMNMKGLQKDTSNRAIAMQFLTRYIRGMNSGGNVHLFTGTPISNTLTEVFHMMRYIMEEEMELLGMDQWDGWFGSFARETEDVELTSTGDYEAITRLKSFINVPELRRMIGQYMDVVFSEDMPEMVPRQVNGKTLTDDLTEAERAELLNGRTENAQDRPYKQVVNSSEDMTEEQLGIFKYVQSLADQWRGMTGKQKKEAMAAGKEVIPIVYDAIAERASFDVRLVDAIGNAGKEGTPELEPNPASKPARVAQNLVDIYQSHPQANQVVFMEKGVNTRVTRSEGPAGAKEKVTYPAFSTQKDMVERLVAGGIPRDEIATVTGSTSKDKRKAIAEAMNRGDIRIVFGSSGSLGVGVNMQKNLRAMHHMDAPWMPGDLEQRNGRGHRQGNQWNTVLEYRYLTDRLDGRRWQVLAIKNKFISDFLKGTGEQRVLEGDAASSEQDDILSTFSDAAGDPRILLREKFNKKVEQLKARKRMHDRAKADAKRNINAGQEKVERMNGALKLLHDNNMVQQVVDALQAMQGDAFKIRLNGKTFKKRAEADAHLKDKLPIQVREGEDAQQIGQYAGLPLYGYWPRFAVKPRLYVDIAGRHIEANGPTLRSLESQLRKFRDHAENDLKVRVSEAEATMQNMHRLLDEPFHMADQLAEAQQKVADIETDIASNPVAPPLWLRSGAPADTPVHWKGQAFTVTGHRWTNDGYFVTAEDAEGGVVIPYLEARDDQGMPIYEEHAFEPAEIIEKDNDTEPPKFSREGQHTQSEARYLARIKLPASESVRDRIIAAKQARHGGESNAHDESRKSVDNPPKTQFANAQQRAQQYRAVLADPIKKIQQQVPVEVSERDPMALYGPEGAGVEGVYDGGRIILFAGNIANAKRAREVLRHEAVGHYGMERMLGGEYRSILNQVRKLHGDDKIKPLVEETARRYPKLRRDSDRFQEELIAVAAEKNVKTTFMQRVANAVKRFLRRVGLLKVDISPNELMELVQRAAQHAHTTPPEVAGVDTIRGRHPLFSRPDDALQAALDEINADDMETIGGFGETTGAAIHDMHSRYMKYLAHPRHIAALYDQFVPVFRAANAQQEERNATLEAFHRDYTPYGDLGLSSQERINQVLELGRLTANVYTQEQLTKGVTNEGTTRTVSTDEQGIPHIVSRPVNAELTAPGDTVQLTVEEAQAYLSLRKLFDDALDQFRDQLLRDVGFPDVADMQDTLAGLRNLRKQVGEAAPEAAQIDHLIAFAEDIEQAQRTGYVPFARYGDYVVAVKQRHYDIRYEDLGDGSFVATGVPEALDDFMQSIGATRDTDLGGWIVTGEQRSSLEHENETTVYSEKVETGLRDKFGRDSESRVRRQERPVDEIPGVKKAKQRIRKQWVDDNPNRRIVSFETVKKAGGGDIDLTALDALAEVAQVDEATWDAVRNELGKAVAQQGFRSHFFQSTNVPGYTTDFKRAIADYMVGMSGFLARRRHSGAWDEAINNIQGAQLTEYSNKYRDYFNNPKEEYSALRQFAFIDKIGLNLSSALVNLTQTLTTTIPTLHQIANPAIVETEIARAGKDALAMMTPKAGKNIFDLDAAPADLAEEMRQANDAGLFLPLNALEMMGQANARSARGRQISKKFDSATEWLGLPFSAAERLNRLVSFIAAVRLAKRQGAEIRIRNHFKNDKWAWDSFGRQFTPYDFAEWLTFESQMQMGKINRPTAFRSVGSVIFQFKSFMIQMMEKLYRDWNMHGNAGKLSVISTMVVLQAFSGVFGLPGADDMKKLFEWLYELKTNKKIDLNAELRELLYGRTGSLLVTDSITSGLPYYFGWDLTYRIGMGNFIPAMYGSTGLFPLDVLLTIGGPGVDSTLGRAIKTGGAVFAGNYRRAAQEMLPIWARNPLRAYYWSTDAVRTSRGYKVLDNSQLSTADIAAKTIGIQPSEVSRQYDYRHSQWIAEHATDNVTRHLKISLARALVRRSQNNNPELEGDLDQDVQDALHAIREFNKNAKPANRIDTRPSSFDYYIKRERNAQRGILRSAPRDARQEAAKRAESYGIGLGR